MLSGLNTKVRPHREKSRRALCPLLYYHLGRLANQVPLQLVAVHTIGSVRGHQTGYLLDHQRGISQLPMMSQSKSVPDQVFTVLWRVGCEPDASWRPLFMNVSSTFQPRRVISSKIPSILRNRRKLISLHQKNIPHSVVRQDISGHGVAEEGASKMRGYVGFGG